jgi:hypothetical protein
VSPSAPVLRVLAANLARTPTAEAVANARKITGEHFNITFVWSNVEPGQVSVVMEEKAPLGGPALIATADTFVDDNLITAEEKAEILSRVFLDMAEKMAIRGKAKIDAVFSAVEALA